jgi:FkbM family methyltransferase
MRRGEVWRYGGMERRSEASRSFVEVDTGPGRGRRGWTGSSGESSKVARSRALHRLPPRQWSPRARVEREAERLRRDRGRSVWARTKVLIHATLRRFGYRLMPIAMSSGDECLHAMLLQHGIDLIFDIGANTGQFASQVFERGYTGRIVSFEPQSAAHAALIAKSRTNPRWQVAERCCLGDRDGETEIHLSQNSISSSVLPLTAEHTSLSPEAGYAGVERVPLRRLDDLARRHLDGSRAALLKIDVQGYEQQVMAGASETLARVRALQVEMSLRSVYEGQLLFLPMLTSIQGLGFQPVQFTSCFVDPANGRWLQADGLFFR